MPPGALVVGIIGAAVGVIGLVESMSATDAATRANKEAREQQEKLSKFNLAKATIAGQIQNRANEIHAVWVNHYLPCELSTVDEICAEPEAVPNTALVAQRAIAEAAKVFALRRKHAIYCVNPQYIGVRAEIDFDIETEQADLASGLILTQVNTEIARVKLLNAQNQANRMNIINAGRNHALSVTPGLNALADMYSSLSKDSQAAIDNASKAQGYAITTLVNQGQELLKGDNAVGRMIRGQDAVQPSSGRQYVGINQAPTPINIQVDSIRERAAQNDATGEATPYSGDDNG